MMGLPLLLLLLFVSVGVAGGELLFPLDSGSAQWTVTPANGSFTIPALVPGCVHLDLLRAGLIDEPNHGYSAQLQAWIPRDNFTYTAAFTAPPALASLPHQYLVLAGVDTAAAVSLNGVPLGEVDNMHRTHLLPLPAGALRGNNSLRLAFTGAVPASLARQAQCEALSPPCNFGNCSCPAPWPGPAPSPLPINAYLRKEQMSFSWDFAPATGTAGLREAPVLLGFASAALRPGAVVRMERDERSWNVNITVRVLTGGGGGGPAGGAERLPPWP